MLEPTTFVVLSAYSHPSSSARPLLLFATPDTSLEDNIVDSSSDEDYNSANNDNYDDDDSDEQDVITPSDLALMMDTSSTSCPNQQDA